MIKSPLLLLVSLLAAGTLCAQSEPQKKGPLNKPTPPANIHQADAPPPTDKVPAPVATPDAQADAATASTPALEKNPPPLDPANMDTSVKPADDFYEYANGTWIKKNPVPPEFSRWSSFNELTERNNDALREIAEKAAADTATDKGKDKLEKVASEDLQKVGDYYASGMNEPAIDAAKTAPLTDEFKKIDAIKDLKDLEAEIAHLHMMGVTAFFGFTSGQDDKDSTKVIGQAFQGGLGLPDRDYYTKPDDASKKIREEYVDHVGKMFALLGDKPAVASGHAKTVMTIETALATPAMTRVQLRDPQAVYHKMTQADLQKMTPDFNWETYFTDVNLPAPGDINVATLDFFKAFNKTFTTVAIDDWKTYLRWHLIHATAPDLSKDFVDENFRFFETTLRGTAQIKPRWKRVVASTDASLGEALGKLYVAEKFPPEAKERALEMVHNLEDALSDRIKTLDWMDQPTKDEALKKLAAFAVKIGYPDKWRDYSTLKVDRGPYVMNSIRAGIFESERQLKKVGKPVDRSEWGMTPPTVNAYYNPNMNEIVFPAGILQPPFFDPKADDAVNYGGMGAVIGHEMTHGFDDQGRQYDAQGNLRDWWSKASSDEYNKRAKKIIEEYAEFEPLPGLHLNGELTQGENIADIGGVRLAYMALQKALAKHPEEANKKIDGFTPQQRFFLAFAQIWRGNMREQEQRLRVNTDPHSPGRFRTIGPLSNFDEFAQAFDIPAGSKMIRPEDKRVNIW
ncbi:MAG: M13-type metalloendopeptidase [Chthoniobacterales bacterium]